MTDIKLKEKILRKIRKDIETIFKNSKISDWKVTSFGKKSSGYSVHLVSQQRLVMNGDSLRIEASVSLGDDGSMNTLKCPRLFLGCESRDNRGFDKLYLDVRRVFAHANDPLLDIADELHSIARIKVGQHLAKKNLESSVSEGQLQAEKELFDIYGALCSTSDIALVD